MDSMFQRSIESYEKTLMESTANALIFFDRTFLDVLCYSALEGIPIDQEMKTFAEINRHNSNVFILPPWQEIYQTDTQRKQNWNEAVFAYNKMIQTYRIRPCGSPQNPCQRKDRLCLGFHQEQLKQSFHFI